MKKHILLLGASTLFISFSSFAGGADVTTPTDVTAPPYTTHWYFGAQAGLAVLVNAPNDLNPDTGLATSLQFGYRFGQARAEGQLIYTNNYDNTTNPGSKHSHLLAGLVNAYYDYPLNSKLIPYIGGGLGYGHFWGNTTVFTTNGSSDAFAYQGIIGLDYLINSTIRLGLNYHALFWTGTTQSSFQNLINLSVNVLF